MAQTLIHWNVEDQSFWEREGKRTAYRNLWISIPCLLCGFAVWMFWSIITTKMQELGFQFDPDPAKNKAMLYTLISIAGLTGATLRIPNSFFVALSGGRNVVAVTTALLILGTRPWIGAACSRHVILHFCNPVCIVRNRRRCLRVLDVQYQPSFSRSEFRAPHWDSMPV